MYYRVLFTFVIMISVLPVAESQEKTTYSIQPDSTADIPLNSLISVTGYSNNLIYLGSTISGTQPFYYGSLIYGFRNELFISSSFFHINKRNPFLSIFNETINYSHVINSWFDYSLSFSGYQVSKAISDTIFNNCYNGDFTLGFDWRILYTKLSIGDLISDKDNSIYLQVRNSHYFETRSFYKGRLNISFDPYINILSGTYTKYDYSKTAGLTSQVNNLKGSDPGKKKVSGSKHAGLIEVDFGIPVALNSDRFTIETEPGYILPVHTYPGFPDSKGFIFITSIYFNIL